MKYIIQIALVTICVALVGAGCKSVLTSDDAIRTESDVYTPSLRSAYDPGTPEEEILSDLKGQLEKVVDYDPDLRILAAVFFREEIPYRQFEALFSEYEFKISTDQQTISLVHPNCLERLPLTPELLGSDSVLNNLTNVPPCVSPHDVDDIKVEGFIALVMAQNALRLWEDDSIPIRGIGIKGTEALGAKTMWYIPRPRDPLR
ncbi:hypothetical protein KJ969_02200 [Patescibacteria group bacterium]|nr:hypothetical protein [Patescibacteria group bacterium]MBU1922342.1 hypothetical protein [Patescibacteria group bacterium]